MATMNQMAVMLSLLELHGRLVLMKHAHKHISQALCFYPLSVSLLTDVQAKPCSSVYINL